MKQNTKVALFRKLVEFTGIFQKKSDFIPNALGSADTLYKSYPPLCNLIKLAFVLLLSYNNHLSFLPLQVLSESMCSESWARR